MSYDAEALANLISVIWKTRYKFWKKEKKRLQYKKTV